MADAKQSASDRDDPKRDGRYQVWHANDSEAVYQSRMEGEPYVHGYTLVADVEARDLQHAVELTVHGDRAWWLNPQVKISVVGSRSTAAGDVLFDPRGQGYRFEGHRSFSEVEAAAIPLSSPAELVERGGGAAPQRQGRQEVSPADLVEGMGSPQRTQQQMQREVQGHSMSM